MPKLTDHQSGDFVKLLFIGDSGTGKTGALTSLVAAGYTLKILDFDNGLDALKQWAGKECPDKLANVDFETVRDTVTASTGGPKVKAEAYIKSLKLMSEWPDGSNPAEGGPNEIFVVDSLTTLGKAALEWAKAMNPTAKDGRQWYFAAQQSLENVIAMLTSETFHANLILISHINYKELEEDGMNKGYPSAVGSKMGPTIPKYFNTMIQAETKGSGKSLRRTIRTLPSAMIDNKNPAPFKLQDEYDLGTGLAEIFKGLKSL